MSKSFSMSLWVFGVVAFSAFAVTGADSFLLQKSYAFFSGEALNRPFALNGVVQGFEFVILSLVYDLAFFFGIAVLALLLARPLMKQVSIPQASYFLLVLCGGIIIPNIIIRYNLYCLLQR